MAYRDLINEFARLLQQGHNDKEGPDVVTFIPKGEVPPMGKQATYARYVVDYRPEKDEPWRLRITYGGEDKLEYHGDTTTQVPLWKLLNYN